MSQTLFEILVREISDKVSNLTEHLASGRAKDYAEYREICGKIRALREHEAYVKHLERQHIQGDEDD